MQEKAGGVFCKSRKAAAVLPASLEDAFDWLRDVKPARPTSAPGLGSPPPTSAPGLTGLISNHIYTADLSSPPPTSAPGLTGLMRPHLRRD